VTTQDLIGTARSLVADQEGLLAMDESTPTCNRRFAASGIPQTKEARRAYRELIVTTPLKVLTHCKIPVLVHR
jgi:fructose-bisphosphate aldolase class I